VTSAEPLDGEFSPLSARAAPWIDRLSALSRRLEHTPPRGGGVVTRPHPLAVMVHRGGMRVVIAPAQLWNANDGVLTPLLSREAASDSKLLLLGRPREPDLERALNYGLSAVLAEEPAPQELEVALYQAMEALELRARSESRGKWLNRYRYELGELIEIARALTTEREIDKLLGLILEKARFITGADAGSIYTVEGEDADPLRRFLHFKLSQNDSVSFDSREFTVPVSPRSMAGYVALHNQTLNIDDVYEMPPGSPFGFDRSFDDKVGYRTKSMLVTPLTSSKGEVIGVLQLINRKREPELKLLGADDAESHVLPFDERSRELVSTLAAQAGIALENAVLYEEIRTIFDGFVRASVDAIDARDPTTSGHSHRVAELTVGLAQAVERSSTGAFAGVRWKREDLREIEYASLLHDFGKIGVREAVLVKAKKLYPHELELIRQRFEFVMRTTEAELLAKKLRALERGASSAELVAIDAELAERRTVLTASLGVVEEANEPTVLAAGNFKRIEELGRETYCRLDGCEMPLLSSEEVRSLSVNRGSLRAEEYDEIRSHVVHTFRFLSKIPWGHSFSRVAQIAGAHHERLNGTGYPNRLRAEEIPLQSKMMSVSDIFDALTASDRPYKRAMPVEKALDILGFEVKDGHLDGELVRIFTEAKPWGSLISGSR
jgi:HD-GYP domain-containing protein (c-di-GMP phosphodiesterase class II)